MRRAILVWMLVAPVPMRASPLDQYTPANLVVAGARGGLRGAIESPIQWDMLCSGNPLAKGCM